MVTRKLFVAGFVAVLLALPAYAQSVPDNQSEGLEQPSSRREKSTAPQKAKRSVPRPDKDRPVDEAQGFTTAAATEVSPPVLAPESPKPAERQVQFTAPVAPEWNNELASDKSRPGVVRLGVRQVSIINGNAQTEDPEEQTQGCTVDCDGGSECQECQSCCAEFAQHRSFLTGEYLYLKSYGPDFVHATQQNAAPAGQGTVPFGLAQNLIQPWQPAFRVAGGYALDACSSITATYTQFSSHVTDTLNLPGGTDFGSAISSVLVPGTINAGTTFSQITADSAVAFKTADVMYSRLVAGNDYSYLNFDVGARYGHLRQGFTQDAEFAQPNNPQLTTTKINFDGVGLRTGFDGRRRLGLSKISAYGQGFASVLFGECASSYTQTNTLTSTTLAANNWESARVIPILEYELGLSWTSCSGCWRLSTGYYTAFWFNTITTPSYIQAVQGNSFTRLGDTMTFTGAVAHAELRF